MTGTYTWPRGLRRRLARRAWWTRYRTATTLVLLFVAGALWHAPWYMLTHPYWLDETWVADSLRAPLSDLPRLTSSTPIGFSFLLRLVPSAAGEQGARLVPLLFSAALAPVGYLLGRELDPDRRGTALVLGATGVLLPAAMLRHDLKQYTADAFVAIALLLLAARAERRRTWHAVARLTAAAVAGLLVSHTTALIGGAVYAALALACLTRRAWRPLLATVAGGTVFVAAVGIDYKLVGQRAASGPLVHFWDRYYLPDTGVGAFLRERGAFAAWHVGLGPWGVAVPLLLLGIAALWSYGHRAAALAVPLLAVLMLVAADLRAYPLWDRRTSLFCFAVGTFVAVFGLAAVAGWLRDRLPPAGRLASLAIVAVLVAQSVSFYRPLPDGETRLVARHVAARYTPGDTIVLDPRMVYGWAYYWRGHRPSFVAAPDRTVGFLPEYARDTGIVVARDSSSQSGPRALAGYVAASPTGTTWVVLARGSKHDSYLSAARGLGSTELLTDGEDYWLIKVTRSP